jgi:3D (Asp-Asp-Asp) domain-containing protein
MVRAILVVVAFLSFLPTAHAGESLGTWKVTRYYTPVEGQERYYNGWSKNVGECKTANLYYAPYGGKYKGSYSAEACMQGQGDIFTTADGTDLRSQEPFTVAACPRKYLGRTLHIAEIGYVVCRDTGGAIYGNRIDVWAGIGEEGYENIQKGAGGNLEVHLKTDE